MAETNGRPTRAGTAGTKSRTKTSTKAGPTSGTTSAAPARKSTSGSPRPRPAPELNGGHPRNGIHLNGASLNGTPLSPSRTPTSSSRTQKPSPRTQKPPSTKLMPPVPAPPEPVREPDIWDERVAGMLAFLRRRLTGQYPVDEFGFDPELTETLVYPVLRLLYQRYFRIECVGVENLPAGGALLVANHSGTVPVDALMLSIGVHDETPTHRHLRLLGADLVFRMPVLSEVARKSGSTLACNPDAERLLRNGEYVGVFPEGFKGIGKPYRDRYKLQRFGRGGFVSAALRTGAPIIPVSIVGAEEIYPIIGNLKPLARVTGLPYVPVTPLFPWLGPLGLLPLPSKWLIGFGEPIDTSPYVDEVDDPITVFNLADHVRETIQQTLHTLLERRPDPFG
jgi:1-acyl-sn-glycerol-3-phosphate acyltransferase